MTDSPGPVCGWRLGCSWIDRGTLNLWQSSPPAPQGLQAFGAGSHGALSGAAARTVPAIAVENFEGSGPESDVIAKGLPAMLCTDLSNVPEIVVVEWIRRAEILREIEFSHSPYADPSTAIPRGHLIQPDAFVRGRVTTTDDEVSWDITLVAAGTGEVIGSVKGSIKSDRFFEASETIVKQLVQLLLQWWRKRHHHHLHHKRRRLLPQPRRPEIISPSRGGPVS